MVSKRDDPVVEFSDLKEDCRKLSNDVREMVISIGTQGKDKLTETKMKLQSAVQTLKGQAREKFDEAYENIMDKSKEAVDKSKKAIVEKPFTAVAASLAAGLAIGYLLRRRNGNR